MPTPKKAPVARTSKTPAKPPLAAAVTHASNHSSTDIHEQVRRRAYELYEHRGRLDGFAEQDWLQAERELRAARSA